MCASISRWHSAASRPAQGTARAAAHSFCTPPPQNLHREAAAALRHGIVSQAMSGDGRQARAAPCRVTHSSLKRCAAWRKHRSGEGIQSSVEQASCSGSKAAHLGVRARAANLLLGRLHRSGRRRWLLLGLAAWPEGPAHQAQALSCTKPTLELQTLQPIWYVNSHGCTSGALTLAKPVWERNKAADSLLKYLPLT